MNVLIPSDNTASVLTKRGGFRRREQPAYRLPVLIVDSGSPALSSTNTLSVRVCDCDSDGVALSCGAVAYTATGLSTGALLAILGCIITLLGKTSHLSSKKISPCHNCFFFCSFTLVWSRRAVSLSHRWLFDRLSGQSGRLSTTRMACGALTPLATCQSVLGHNPDSLILFLKYNLVV